jgi:hypothetical protein
LKKIISELEEAINPMPLFAQPLKLKSNQMEGHIETKGEKVGD